VCSKRERKRKERKERMTCICQYVPLTTDVIRKHFWDASKGVGKEIPLIDVAGDYEMFLEDFCEHYTKVRELRKLRKLLEAYQQMVYDDNDEINTRNSNKFGIDITDFVAVWFKAIEIVHKKHGCKSIEIVCGSLSDDTFTPDGDLDVYGKDYSDVDISSYGKNYESIKDGDTDLGRKYKNWLSQNHIDPYPIDTEADKEYETHFFLSGTSRYEENLGDGAHRSRLEKEGLQFCSGKGQCANKICHNALNGFLFTIIPRKP
jgi:hypothetical protein